MNKSVSVIYVPVMEVMKTAWCYSNTILSLMLSMFLIGAAIICRWFKHLWNRRHPVLLSGDSRNQACGRTVTVAFFHPYCNAGGGGERVLWCAIRSLQNRYDFVKCVVYTGDSASEKEIQMRANERFNIYLERQVHFVYLRSRPFVNPRFYPVFTLLGQSLGSVVLGLEALWKFVPDVYIDTMGFAFTLPVFRYLGGCKVACYVHYPTISTDMLMKVADGRVDFNNAGVIARNAILRNGKLVYYKFFALLYGLVGRCADVVMVNSSWTHGHIKSLWNVQTALFIVYPPCDTKTLVELPLDAYESCKGISKKIISIGQFRPEKNHILQLRAFKRLLELLPRNKKTDFQLVVVGSCRDGEDEARVDSLKKEAGKLKIGKFVKFCVNVPYEELHSHLVESVVGLHTMTDEHFGIGVVEFMAAGVIPIAHNSGGPKLDIVLDWKGLNTGYLANDVDSYAAALHEVLKKTSHDRYQIASNARDSVKKRFSDETFKKHFLSATELLLA